MMEKHVDGKEKKKTYRNFITGTTALFYVSATGNLRFRNVKRTVRTAETYVSQKKNIKTMETLHDFLPEVF